MFLIGITKRVTEIQTEIEIRASAKPLSTAVAPLFPKSTQKSRKQPPEV